MLMSRFPGLLPRVDSYSQCSKGRREEMEWTRQCRSRRRVMLRGHREYDISIRTLPAERVGYYEEALCYCSEHTTASLSLSPEAQIMWADSGAMLETARNSLNRYARLQEAPVENRSIDDRSLQVVLVPDSSPSTLVPRNPPS